MKRNLVFAALVAFFAVLSAIPSSAVTSTVKGVCKDAEGNPVVGAEVVWHNLDNGRTYTLKTNNKGEYFSLGIDLGKYLVTLRKDGKELDTAKDFPVTTDEVTLDFDSKKTQEQAVQDTAKKQGMTPEQVKAMQEQAKAAQAQAATTEKYNANVKVANEKLKAATTAQQAGDYDSAISALTEVSQMLPNEDLVWYRLGSVYLDSAKKQTDATEKTKRYTESYNDLQKAVDLKKEAMKNPPPKAAQGAGPAQGAVSDNARLATYYDNLAAAAVRVGKAEDAANAYKQAAELDPQHAAHYYVNLGVVYTNANATGDATMRKQAVEAFDKAIAADPTNADAYFLKGQNLIGMASMDSNNKMTAPEGTAEAFKKYLELKPDGPHVEEAKAMLTAIGSTVETSLGKKKK
jgi:tetratricopeptide (TPR) repeat protein